MKPRLGTVACPVAGCTATAAVFKFAHRAIRDTGRRKAGKLYLHCPEHGQLGFDGKPALQEYILERMKFDGDRPADLEPAPAAPAAAPAPPARAITSNPPPAKPQPAAPAAPAKKPWWDAL